jgi:surface polysaccharide O-acyltransferase-like enzyme
MKGVSQIFAIIVVILWLASATYIAAPASVLQLLPSPPMGGVPPAFLGVLLFLFGIIIIVIWAGLTPEGAVEKSAKPSETTV